VNRGEIWLAQVGGKTQPVVVLTRSEVIDVRQLVTVAEITTQQRGLSVEVAFDEEAAGLNQPSVVNCDGIHTVAQTSLVRTVGSLDGVVMGRVCRAVARALGC
jgi:mRNA-degrading endonuclease toxin of MazEF toxin-antitoxin module